MKGEIFIKLDKLVGERYKERPSDCVIDSHALMVRGGYIKYVANGIFSYYAPLRRITLKIEQIIREEMDAAGGQEVLFPVVLPAYLWQESGRYESVGAELMRTSDRNGAPMLLGMTHEEPAVQLTREYGQSYAKYPFMVYQIQTKFRDEPRARGGLIRTREFLMKDAYSFHTSQEDMDEWYQRCHVAYENVFRRAGLEGVVSVAADSGMMGGDVSHEFMMFTPVGEDSICLCGNCDFRANLEATECVVANETDGGPAAPLAKVRTPNMKTIDDVCGFLNSPVEGSCKAVVYQTEPGGEVIVVFLRGDLDVNETKLKNFLKEEIRPAALTDGELLALGFIGPYGLTGVRALFDASLKGITGLVCGANETDYHYTGLDLERDCGEIEYNDFAKAFENGICPKCGAPSLTVKRGIELGNIFQLGDKYTKTMNMQYADEKGGLHYPIMGCYGIGIERLAAAVCEASRDEYGPIWPVSIAPWHAHVCCLRADDAPVRQKADEIYEALLSERIETIYDDRTVSAGVMFSDADLLGVPVRIVVSPRNLKDGVCEVTARDKSVNKKVPFADIPQYVRDLLCELTNKGAG